MSGDAIVMLIVAMVVIWGGLALAILNLLRHGPVEGRTEHLRRDV